MFRIISTIPPVIFHRSCWGAAQTSNSLDVAAVACWSLAACGGVPWQVEAASAGCGMRWRRVSDRQGEVVSIAQAVVLPDVLCL